MSKHHVVKEEELSTVEPCTKGLMEGACVGRQCRFSGISESSTLPDFGRVFLMLKYTDITQNTYIQS